MANDFSGDASVKALWRMNATDPFLDSSGNSATLVPALPIAWTFGMWWEDTTNYREGDGSLFFTGNYSGCTQDYPANFPFSDSDTIRDGSFTFWAKPTDDVQYAKAVSRWNGNDPHGKVFAVRPGSSGYNCFVDLGYNNGDNVESLDTGWHPTNGQWYHYGVVISKAAKTAHVRVWGVTENAIVLDIVLNFTQDILDHSGYTIFFNVGTEAYLNYQFKGNLDEVVVFTRLLSSAEIDEIRAGVFDGPIATTTTTSTTTTTTTTTTSTTTTTTVIPANCLSLTYCDDVPESPAVCLSLTECEAIELPHIDPCLSLTYCDGLLKSDPAALLSLTKCPTIPLPLGSGTFLIF